MQSARGGGGRAMSHVAREIGGDEELVGREHQALLHGLERQHDRVPMAIGNITRMVFGTVDFCTRNLRPL